MTRKVFENGDVLTPEILNLFIQEGVELLSTNDRDISFAEVDSSFIVVHLHVPPPFEPTFTISTPPLTKTTVLFVRAPDNQTADLVPIVIGGATFKVMTGGRILAQYDGAWTILDYFDGRAPRVMPFSIFPESLTSECVTAQSIAPRAVGTVELDYGAVAQENMADNSVGTAEIIDMAVTESKLKSQSVTSIKIADNSVDSYHMKAKCVTADKLFDPLFLGPDSTGGSNGIAIDPVHRKCYILSGQYASTVPISDAPTDGVVIYVYSGSSVANDPWSITYRDLEGNMTTRSIARGATVAMMSQEFGWLCLGCS